MPSRKKAKGKVRKAAKAVREAKEAEAAKAKEEELMEATNQLQSLTIRDLLQRDQLRRTATQTCQHGIPQLSPDDRKICDEYINEFSNAFLSQEGDINVWGAISAAHKATQAEKYAEVYASKLETVVSMLLSNGTQHILNEDTNRAKVDAFLACYLKNTNWAALLEQETPTNKGNWAATLVEVGCGDIHTLVQYFRKRIPCSCLDEKYKEVKSVTKMGFCFNLKCSQPGKRVGVERSKMFSCSRCGKANYCSVECQRADWKAHKEWCDMCVRYL